MKFICNILEKFGKKGFYSLHRSILFSKLPKRKSYQLHVVTCRCIFTLIFMIEFFMISLFLRTFQHVREI